MIALPGYFTEGRNLDGWKSYPDSWTVTMTRKEPLHSPVLDALRELNEEPTSAFWKSCAEGLDYDKDKLEHKLLWCNIVFGLLVVWAFVEWVIR